MTLSSPSFLKRIEELSRASDLVWIVGLVTGLAFTLIGAYGFAFSESGKFWAYSSLFIRAGHRERRALRLRDRVGICARVRDPRSRPQRGLSAEAHQSGLFENRP
jgi:hypothetical protein